MRTFHVPTLNFPIHSYDNETSQVGAIIIIDIYGNAIIHANGNSFPPIIHMLPPI